MLSRSIRHKLGSAALIALGSAALVWGQTKVDIYPGTNLSSTVGAYPTNTTFVIHPGLYRLPTPINAKDGDVFVGYTACAPPTTSCPAILNGSKLLTSFQQSVSLYYVTNQTQQGEVTISSTQCDPDPPGYLVAYPGCIYPEDLYFDDKPLVHVTSLSDVGPGTWFFDYSNNIIYFYDNPTGHKVETSVTPSAFAWGPANHVTIQELTVEKFAAPIQRGAIGRGWTGTANGLDWVVRNNEVRLNHGDGVDVNFGWKVLSNYIHNNGNLGVSGTLGSYTTPSGVLIQGNEIAFNNYAHASPHFAAGGSDITMSLGVVLRHNYVHDNEGSGVWMDTRNANVLYDDNTIVNNTDEGIFHEISLASTARNNKLFRNGYIHPNWTFWLFGAGILSSTSQGLDAYCNTVEISAQGGNGIDMVAQPHAKWDQPSQNNYYHHNTVVFDGNSGMTGAARGSTTDICCQVFYTANKYDYNTYHLPDLTRKAFYWNDAFNTFAQFQAAGQEKHGSADTNYKGSVPTVAITSPADGSTVSGTVNIQGNAQDDLSKVEFYVDWALKSAESSSPFTFSWDTSSVTKGNHTVAAMAYDTEGMRACYAVTLNVQ